LSRRQRRLLFIFRAKLRRLLRSATMSETSRFGLLDSIH